MIDTIFGHLELDRRGNLFGIFGGERIDDLHRFDADADDLADEADDVFFIVGVVGVAGDAAAFIGADLVLVDDPIEGASVAEAVVEDFGRDFRERERFVDLELGLVFGEPHFLDVVGERHALGFDPLERPGFELFVAEVEFGQLLAGFGEGVRAGRQDIRCWTVGLLVSSHRRLLA